ncbi:GNAT family N-acetyltransferase [Teredinibacter waterburyi]|uniref:GNAT family N-acetyltransferase n=1 Tax=Teredinibacter waterburyi TaxID=1500538 RepID=UPI00165EF163|nr:GNAT family N-acetyltransferase [Teredinibacter waterburyi]
MTAASKSSPSKTPQLPEITIVRVDYNNQAHREDLVAMLDDYACDIMGGGAVLPSDVKAKLGQALADFGGAYSFLAYRGDEPVGLMNCILGFSTFKAAPLLNIHDLAVIASARRLGIGKQLLAEVETLARELGCCKLTLEVLEGNNIAQAAYIQAGFEGYQLDATTGKALFWQKPL